ncbi:MAG TPA: hypothetical protein VGX23_19640 [Actinocrinis sp.]|nr:hypothetical protein [Actinocrinis sp.]
MSVLLPDELVWVLGAIGVTWPNIDEDQLRSMAGQFRQLAGDLENRHNSAIQAVEQMLGLNTSGSIDVFQALWNRTSARHLKDLGRGIGILADAVDVGADIIEAMKVAAIAEFVAFAAQTAAVAAESIATLGLGAGLEVVVVETTREAVTSIVKQAVQQVGQQLKQAMLAPVWDMLDSAGADLAEQLAGEAVGVYQGFRVSRLASLGQGTTDSTSKIADILSGRAR